MAMDLRHYRPSVGQRRQVLNVGQAFPQAFTIYPHNRWSFLPNAMWVESMPLNPRRRLYIGQLYRQAKKIGTRLLISKKTDIPLYEQNIGFFPTHLRKMIFEVFQ
jgi:hypothetical protein